MGDRKPWAWACPDPMSQAHLNKCPQACVINLFFFHRHLTALLFAAARQHRLPRIDAIRCSGFPTRPHALFSPPNSHGKICMVARFTIFVTFLLLLHLHMLPVAIARPPLYHHFPYLIQLQRLCVARLQRRLKSWRRRDLHIYKYKTFDDMR